MGGGWGSKKGFKRCVARFEDAFSRLNNICLTFVNVIAKSHGKERGNKETT
jgi:hypothetical protein